MANLLILRLLNGVQKQLTEPLDLHPPRPIHFELPLQRFRFKLSHMDGHLQHNRRFPNSCFQL